MDVLRLFGELLVGVRLYPFFRPLRGLLFCICLFFALFFWGLLHIPFLPSLVLLLCLGRYGPYLPKQSNSTSEGRKGMWRRPQKKRAKKRQIQKRRPRRGRKNGYNRTPTRSSPNSLRTSMCSLGESS